MRIQAGKDPSIHRAGPRPAAAERLREHDQLQFERSDHRRILALS
jgi:hypothetical protein